ncbi:MAG: hypothetical protein WDA27_10970 [Actinomycetota bacterium]
MRSEQLAISYLAAAVFALVAVRVLSRWLRSRQPQQAHLAWATGLFAVSQTVSAVSATLFDQSKLETAPRWLSTSSSAITWMSILAFFLFLADFIPFPKWAIRFVVAVTPALVVLGAIEQPDLRLGLPQVRLTPDV